MIKEELKRVLLEDLSLVTDMTPSDILEYAKTVEWKNLVFWDLEQLALRDKLHNMGL